MSTQSSEHEEQVMAANSKSSKKSGKGKKFSPEAELAAAQEAIKNLRATVAKLEKNVVKLEDRLEKRVSELRKDAKKFRDAAEKAGKSAVKSATDVGKSAAKSAARKVADWEPAPAPAEKEKVEVVPVEKAPTSEMTVAQLRAAARAQGVAGYSRMTKAQLVAALKR
jgi:hypothetical protein